MVNLTVLINQMKSSVDQLPPHLYAHQGSFSAPMGSAWQPAGSAMAGLIVALLMGLMSKVKKDNMELLSY